MSEKTTNKHCFECAGLRKKQLLFLNVYACKKKETQWTFFEKKKKIMWSWRQKKNNHWHHWRRRILIIKCEEPCRRSSSNMILLLIVIFFSYEHYTITDICKKLNTRHIGALSLCFEGFKQNKQQLLIKVNWKTWRNWCRLTFHSIRVEHKIKANLSFPSRKVLLKNIKQQQFCICATIPCLSY